MANDSVFTVMAMPELLSEGSLKGHLGYLRFTASNSSHVERWWVTNDGTFVADFSRLVSRADAIKLVEKLNGGQAVRIPGEYRLDQLRGKFGKTDTT
jgi:hypothetical protein